MSPIRIMLVDDELNILRAVNRALRDEGYLVSAFTEPARALDYIAHETVDIIISDQSMPGMSGIEFLHKSREHAPDAYRIMLTGHGDFDVSTQAVNNGKVWHFLTKPWSDDELRALLRAAAHRIRVERSGHAEGEAPAQAMEDLIRRRLERDHPGITAVRHSRDGAVLLTKPPGGKG